MLKKILISLFIILFSFQSIYALNMDGFKEMTKDIGKEDVNVLWKGKEIGRFTKEQFISVIKAAEFYEKMDKAEKNKKINVVLKDSPWDIKIGGTFKSEMDIVWYNDDGTILKKVTVAIELVNNKQGGSVYLAYRELTVYLFPAAVLVIIILSIILIVK